MIVYWSEDGEEAYQNVFACATEPTMDNQEIVDGVFKNLAMGRAIVVDEVEKALSPRSEVLYFRRVSQCCQNRGSLFLSG